MPVPLSRVAICLDSSRTNTDHRNVIADLFKLVTRRSTLVCNVWLAACVGLAVVASGCGQEPVTDPAVPTGKTPSANAATESPSSGKGAEPGNPLSQANAATGSEGDGTAAATTSANAHADDNGNSKTSVAKTNAADADSTGTKPLKLTGIEIDIPESWTRVDPPTVRIVDAEFMIPRLTADGFDGRLTFMAAGGDFDSNVSRWSGEFDREGGGPPGIDTTSSPVADTRIVDLRGTWKGPTFQQPGQPRQASRSNYRMLAAVVPFSARSSYFMKFVGPAELIEKHEAAFRKLVETARLQK